MQVAYLVDLFTHLNYLNLQQQGAGNIKLEVRQMFSYLKTEFARLSVNESLE